MDLREYVSLCEREGELKRVKAEVDWDLEMSHVAKINEERGGPALLFENVKGYPSPVLASACTTVSRLALIMGMGKQSAMSEVLRQWATRTANKIAPTWVSSAPCQENVFKGEAINLWKFPVPKVFPGDGGRYFGTTGITITKDPDTGWVNLGTYRLQVLDERSLGVLYIKGKHAELILQKYRERKQPMPVAIVVGADPILFAVAAARLPAFESEYDFAGALRGAPIEVFKGETVDLPIPASAEIVVEGEVDADDTRPEGPFGEYTGYYSGVGTTPRPWVKIKRLYHRDNPIFWLTTVGRAVTDTHMLMTMTYGASLWQQLERMRIPGLKAVYCPPEAAGRFLAIISVKQMYPGHVNQVGTAAISTEMGAYGLKTVIVVDDDIDPFDIPRVLWAVAFRFQPSRAQIINRGRATPLDPSLPVDSRDITSRIIIDATIPYEWKEKPVPVELDPDTVKRVLARWSEYGL